MYIANSSLAVGVSVGRCLTLCPVMKRQHVRVEPPLHFWDRVQQPPRPQTQEQR